VRSELRSGSDSSAERRLIDDGIRYMRDGVPIRFRLLLWSLRRLRPMTTCAVVIECRERRAVQSRSRRICG
jgi:hypothetical protein